MNRAVLRYIKIVTAVFVFSVALWGAAGEARAAITLQPASGPWTGVDTGYTAYPDLQFYSPIPPTSYSATYDYGCEQSTTGALACHKMYPTENVNDKYDCGSTTPNNPWNLGSAWLFNNCVFTGDITPPSPNPVVTLTVVSASQIDVSWTPSSDAESGIAFYRVFRFQGVCCSPMPISPNIDVLAPSTIYSHMGLSPSTSYGYYVLAYDFAGNFSGSAGTRYAVTPAAPPPPIVSFFANPTSITIPPGGSSTLTWTVANATACTASGDWSGTKNAADGTHTEAVSPTTAGVYTYTITCAGTTAPPATATATVTVTTIPPTVTLSPPSITIPPGTSTTLTWSSTNATACSAPWTTSTATSGSQTVTPTASTTYTISCTGPGGGPIPASATVTISPPSVTLTGPSSVLSGTSPTLSWTVTNGTGATCTASSVPSGWTGTKSEMGGTEAAPPITVPTNYTLSCAGPGGMGSSMLPIGITALPPPLVNLTPPTATILLGGSATLTWSSTNATACSASWTASTATSGSQTVTPTTTTTYMITCTGPGGTGTDSSGVTVTLPPPPSVSLSATPPGITIPPGGSSTLTWTVANATACTASGDWSGTKNAADGTHTEAVSPTTAGVHTYTISCTGPGGGPIPASATVTVTLVPPTVSLTPPSQTILLGGSATLTWSSTNATACSASWTASTATSGSQTVTPTTTTTYMITCTGPGGTGTDSSGVTVTLPINALPVAVIAVTPISGIAPLAVSADGGGSTDSDGTIVEYSWNWGDGLSDTGVSVSHTYATPNVYTLSLMVRDNQGGTNVATTNITVVVAIAPPPPPVPVSICTAACTIDSDCAVGLVCGPSKFCIAASAGLGPVRSFGYLSRIDGSMSQSGNPTPATFPAGTTSVIMSVKTDVNADCQYSTFSNTPYGASVMKTFSTNGTTAHAVALTGLTSVTATTYDYYVRCRDLANGIVNDTDYTISFTTNAPNVVSGPNPYTCLINKNFIKNNIPYLFDICIPR